MSGEIGKECIRDARYSLGWPPIHRPAVQGWRPWRSRRCLPSWCRRMLWARDGRRDFRRRTRYLPCQDMVQEKKRDERNESMKSDSTSQAQCGDLGGAAIPEDNPNMVFPITICQQRPLRTQPRNVASVFYASRRLDSAGPLVSLTKF